MIQDEADTFLRYEADGKTIELPIERLCICGIGRAGTNMVVLADKMASREHAIIRRNATGQCVLSDLGSTNGTWLNGRSVNTPTALSSGDVVRIGSHQIDFVQTEDFTAADSHPARTQFFVEQQLVSVLVVDVRGYTNLSMRMGSERSTEMMSYIFREAGAVLDEAQCWSTKYIGDAIMAVWTHGNNGLTRSDVVNAFDVVSAYQGIFRLAERKYSPPLPLRFGCGFNVGVASVGNIGSASASDFTAMGETVNTAFRLESATKDVGCDVLIAANVFETLTDATTRPADMIDMTVRGQSEPIQALPLRFGDMSAFVAALLA